MNKGGLETEDELFRIEEEKRYSAQNAFGGNGAPILASGNGERCARIIVQTATPGSIVPTTTPAVAPTDGARTASRDLRTITRGSAWPLALWNGHDPHT
jgi:hypothetical protein